MEEDWRRIRKLEEHWRKEWRRAGGSGGEGLEDDWWIGGGLEDDCRRTEGGLEEGVVTIGGEIGGGLEEDWKMICGIVWWPRRASTFMLMRVLGRISQLTA